jgi:4-amino-4-deoxy-L-arabinose transferase-like glycosyltransferase
VSAPADARSPWRAQLWLLFILAGALALRLALWSQPLHQPANDEVEYVTVARDLLAGRGWSFYEHYHWLRAPLYPLFLAASLWAAGGDLHRAALPNLALSVLNVALAYWLARLLVGARSAPLAALLTAVLWTNATFASLYMSETLLTTLFSGGLVALCGGLAPPGPARASRPPYGRVALAGLLFGLAALTRSAIMLFLPIAALWLVREWLRRGARGQALALGALLIATAAVPIAPWTLRNTLAYGRPILIETGLSYNLWAISEPREDLDTIQHTLERIPNPSDRSDYATARGLERLREDPAIVLRKIWPNWVFLARVKPIQDRFLLESYYDSVGLPLFVAALVFDDLLYVLIALAALAGIAAALRGQSGRMAQRCAWLCAAWCLYLLATFVLTHGEARYRHFLFPVLIPYAAWALAHLRSPRAVLPRAPWQRAALTVAALVFGWTIVTSYPHTWAAENLARGWYTLAGDMLRLAGHPLAALDAYERAAQAQRVPDPLLRLGDAARAAGLPDRALEAYRRALRRNPIYEPAAARLGDLLREQGDSNGARASFLGDYLDQQRMADWSWRELQVQPRPSIDVGDGLDYGYVGGVYPAEQVAGAYARWTRAEAWLRLGAPQQAPPPATLVLRLAAARPGLAAVPVEVCANRRCMAIQVASAWREYRLPASGQGASLLVEIRSPTFRAADDRELGILIDRVQWR